MSISGRRAAARKAANRRKADECPDHQPICVERFGVGSLMVLFTFRCKSCDWIMKCDRTIAKREGFPIPSDDDEVVELSQTDKRGKGS